MQPEGCIEIADCRPGFTWPVGPYMFGVSGNCHPPLKGDRWFYPGLVVQEESAERPAAEATVPTRAAS